MKIKCQPDDFVVTERFCCNLSGGPFAVYRLDKCDIGTLEAIQQLCRVWNLAPRQVAHAGLKDRRARTSQVISIKHGPPAELQQQRFSLTFLGTTKAAVTADAIQGNHFCLMLRRLSNITATAVERRIADVSDLAVPNYFDQQRFGSLGYSAEFVAAAWCRRDFERAVWLALADPNPHDRSDEKRQKSILRDHWGDWGGCKEKLNRSHRRSVVTYLVDHPTGFRKAFGLIRPDLRGLYLSAFQSAVWNRMLAAQVTEASTNLPRETLADTSVPLGLLDAESGLPESLPLVSARNRGLSAEVMRLVTPALAPYQMDLSDMKVIFPRDRFFSRGERACVLRPQKFEYQRRPDELYSGYDCLELQFELPRGCYATMVIRSLMAGLQTDSSDTQQPVERKQHDES